jgi:hypothetical protein
LRDSSEKLSIIAIDHARRAYPFILGVKAVEAKASTVKAKAKAFALHATTLSYANFAH